VQAVSNVVSRYTGSRGCPQARFLLASLEAGAGQHETGTAVVGAGAEGECRAATVPFMARDWCEREPDRVASLGHVRCAHQTSLPSRTPRSLAYARGVRLARQSPQRWTRAFAWGLVRGGCNVDTSSGIGAATARSVLARRRG